MKKQCTKRYCYQEEIVLAKVVLTYQFPQIYITSLVLNWQQSIAINEQTYIFCTNN
jgi:hypothetical protein